LGFFFSLLVPAIVLITIGTGPFRLLNITFALFALSVASWAFFTLLLRLSLLFEVGSSALFVQLVGFSFLIMGPLLLAFTIRYLNFHNKMAYLAVFAGIFAVIPISLRLFDSALLTEAMITPEGMIQVIFSPLGIISALIPILFFAISLYLFWQSRKTAKDKSLTISIAFLILGIMAGIAKTPLPITTALLTSSIAILGFSVISQQLFNPLHERTEDLQREILERQQIELALRASEKQYRSVVDHALQGIIISQHGQIVYANPTYCHMTGYEPEEILSWTMDEYLHYTQTIWYESAI
jgi:PAS domain-containing protein